MPTTCSCGSAVGPSGRCAKGHLQPGHAHRFGKGNTAARKSRAKRVVQRVKEALVPAKGMTIKFYAGGELVEEVPIRWKRWDEDEWNEGDDFL